MRTTVRLDDDLASHVDAIRCDADDSDAEAVREAIRRSKRVDELEAQVDALETELRQTEAQLDEANRKLQEAHSSIETTNELVRKVDSEIEVRQQEAELTRERRRRENKKEDAGALTRVKWALFGMGND